VIKPNNFYTLFVGNKENYINWYDGRWLRVNSPITPSLIIKHFKWQTAIGSYPIFIKDGIEYCKWICIDVDSHERVPKELRDKIKEEENWKFKLLKLEKEYRRKVSKFIKEMQKDYCMNLTKSGLLRAPHLLLEDSGGGYHIWILLKDGTTLLEAGKYIQMIKPAVYNYYKCYSNLKGTDLPEIYPKQYSTEHLEQGLGNAVRLPNGLNFGKDTYCKVLYGDLATVKQNDIKVIANEYDGPDVLTLNGYATKREVVEYYEPQQVGNKLEFWLYFPRIRPCLKKIMTGETQCYASHGHNMRMALSHEANYFNMDINLIPYLFHNQYDFDEDYTRLMITSILKNSNNVRDRRYGCKKIKELGYCENGCTYEKWVNSKDMKYIL